MSPYIILLFIALYFALLFVIGRVTSRNSGNADFFLGKRESPWYIVAFGMIGASLSGVTFISMPGAVGQVVMGQPNGFSYMQMVLGYLPGYAVIAFVLMPLYYRLNLTSIYSYLGGRLGPASYKTGAWFFLVSRLIGSAFRLYLVAIVLQVGVFDRLNFNMPFALTVSLTILLIWLYTARGGIKTIIWTDTLQTAFMLVAVGVSVYVISGQLGLDPAHLGEAIRQAELGQWFFTDNSNDPRFFWKQFLGGMFIAIVMTGLDQDMMQKNLSCRNIGEAQKNMISFSLVLVAVNALFLSLGALLYMFATAHPEIPTVLKGDELFPTLALQGYLGPVVAVCFTLGLIAAAYSSADSALTALTTSFCVDILGISTDDDRAVRVRRWVHMGVSVAMIGVILFFKAVNDDSVINQVFTVAGYTYGPLLGLYFFGLFTRLNVRDKWVPVVCVLSPIICYVLSTNSESLFNGYRFGFELVLVNGAITFAGLMVLARRPLA